MTLFITFKDAPDTQNNLSYKRVTGSPSCHIPENVLVVVSGREQRLVAHVFAAAEQLCGPVGIGVALDVADEKDVVAAVMAALVAAFEMRGGTDQHRRATLGIKWSISTVPDLLTGKCPMAGTQD